MSTDEDLENIDGWIEHFRDIGWLDWLPEEEFRRMWDEIPEGNRRHTFIPKVIRRKSGESTYYRCVKGCCSIMWHPHFGNTGGIGRPGCRCEDMEDPRDPDEVRRVTLESLLQIGEEYPNAATTRDGYTPSMAEIRQDYIEGRSFRTITTAPLSDEFDRALAEHDAGVLEAFVDSLHIGSRPTPTGPEALDAIALAHSRAAKLRSES